MTFLWEAYKRALFVPFVPIIWAVMSVFSIVAAPFGTADGLTLGARAIFWPLMIGAGVLVGAALRVLVQQILCVTNIFLEIALIAVLASAILSAPAIWLLDRLIDPPDARLASLWTVALYVFLVSVSVSALRHSLRPGGLLVPARLLPPAARQPGPRLYARLEPGVQAPLLRLQVRDHYVDVVTERGQASLLMRFADAMAELDGVPGLQVHRSHWVADAAVARVRRERGKHILETRDGAEIPVSKTYLPQVIARGLIEGDQA